MNIYINTHIYIVSRKANISLTSTKLSSFASCFSVNKVTDLTLTGKIFRSLQYYWNVDLILDRYNETGLLSFLFLQIIVRYLSIMLRTVKDLSLRYGPCTQNVYIINEDKTVNNIRCSAHFCSWVC